nr:LysM peptidoglycan-binding domain-containing protein [Kineosporia babensis]
MASAPSRSADTNPPPSTSPASREALTGSEEEKELPAVRAVVVQPRGSGTTLWGLASTYLGDGTRWNEIWALNEGRRQNDGTTMQTPSFLRPGWTILIPGPDQQIPARTKTDSPHPEQDPTAHRVRYTIAAGDRLADIADRFLGDPHTYPRLHALNQGEVTDADHIETGATIWLPEQTHDRGTRRHARGIASPQVEDETSRTTTSDRKNRHGERGDDVTTSPQRPRPSTEASAPRPQPVTPSPSTSSSAPDTRPGPTSPPATPTPERSAPASSTTSTGGSWQWILGLGGGILAILLLRRSRTRRNDWTRNRPPHQRRGTGSDEGQSITEPEGDHELDTVQTLGSLTSVQQEQLSTDSANDLRRPAIDQARVAIHRMAQETFASRTTPSSPDHQTELAPNPAAGQLIPEREPDVPAATHHQGQAEPALHPSPSRATPPLPAVASTAAPSQEPLRVPHLLPLPDNHQDHPQILSRPTSVNGTHRRARHRAEPPTEHPTPQVRAASPPQPDRDRPPGTLEHAAPGAVGQPQPAVSNSLTAAASEPQRALAAPETHEENWESRPPKDQTSALPLQSAQIRLFGTPAVLDSTGAPVTGLRRQALALLLYLVLHPDGGATDQLQEALWPDATLASAKKRFSTELSNLRRTMRTAAGVHDQSFDAVPADRGHYRLLPSLDIDVWTFTRELALARTDPEHREQHLRRALTAQNGHLADDGTTGYPWLTPHRNHFRRERARAKRALADLIQAEHPHEARALITQAEQAETGLPPAAHTKITPVSPTGPRTTP